MQIKYGKSINSNLTNTGTRQDEVCKVNDMSANLSEWTTEYNPESEGPPFGQASVYPTLKRGGNYFYNSDSSYVGRTSSRYLYFGSTGTSTKEKSIGFRLTLYMQ